jgi:hypothetical protein
MSVNPKYREIMSRFPNLFKEEPRSGFSVGDGWMPLLEILCPILEYQILSLPYEQHKEMYVAQVKEKFGGLRFYMTKATPFMEGAINMAENMSYSICEECGAPGERRNSGWIQTLCTRHHNLREKAKKKK